MKTTQKEDKDMTLTEKKEGILKELEALGWADIAVVGSSGEWKLKTWLSQQLDTYAEAVREETVGDILDVIWGEEKNGFVKANSLIEYIEEKYLQSQKKGQTEEEV